MKKRFDWLDVVLLSKIAFLTGMLTMSIILVVRGAS